MERILVWDWPVRLGHWLMVAAFGIAWLTGESEAWRLVHVWAGGTVVGVVLFRLVWGFIGTRHARFSSFVRGPAAVMEHLSAMLRGQPGHEAGHNAAGGWAILALLGLALAAGATGWLQYQDLVGDWMEELHEGVVNAMLAVVAVHVAGVVLTSLVLRENLARAMVTGRKFGRPDEAIASGWFLAVPLLLACAALSAWWMAR